MVSSLIRHPATVALVALCAAGLGGCESTGGSHPPSAHALNDPKQLLPIADAARHDGDFTGAASIYQRALDNGGDPIAARLGLADSLAGEGQYDLAIAQYQQVGAAAPHLPDVPMGIGRTNLSRHRPAEALVAFQAALAMNPGLAAAWNGKGVALDHMERHDDAQVAYRTGLSVAPDDHVLRNNYGLSLALSGRYAQSVQVLSSLAQEQGASPRNRQNLALALGLQGNQADARKVGEADLDAAAVEANLRFYDQARGLTAAVPATASLPPPPAATAPAAGKPAPAASGPS